jgi:hypothetical protein
MLRQVIKHFVLVGSVRETLSAGTNKREHEIIVLQQLVMNELENQRIRLYSRQHDRLDSMSCLGKTAKNIILFPAALFLLP